MGSRDLLKVALHRVAVIAGYSVLLLLYVVYFLFFRS